MSRESPEAVAKGDEKEAPAAPETVVTAKIDIEHVFVQDDPRKWSVNRKNATLFIISAASMIAGLSANIQNPSNAEIEQQLHGTSSEISLSLAFFILTQGGTPLLWSAISEIKGRKLVYLLSLILYTIASAVVASAKTIVVVIVMRCVQGMGSSAVIAIGAATLADIFEPHERGTKMGIYYAAPMLGPSLGPILGGVLTQGFGWRASFWFLVIFGGLNLLSFLLLFKDTFRRERSVAYQSALRKRAREKEREKDAAKEGEKEKEKGDASEMSTVVAGSARASVEKEQKDDETKEAKVQGQPKQDETNETTKDTQDIEPSADGTDDVVDARDIEEAVPLPATVELPPLKEVKLSLLDVNPLKPITVVLGRKNNIAILTASGLLFAFNFSITYTCSRTLGMHYGYNALKIGLVLLAYGIGNIAGSILGGKWSDRVLARLTAKNGGVRRAEMRLESTVHAMWFLPPAVIGYAWTCQQHVHVSAICVMLFLAGFFSLWIYSSTLAYIVDANVGRSSSAVATNSAFRGVFACIAAEIAVPLQDGIGDGGMYTLWAGLMALSEVLILLVIWKGGNWREEAAQKEERYLKKEDNKGSSKDKS